MTVYLGTFGKVELQREFDGSSLEGEINTSDVNVTEKRFGISDISNTPTTGLKHGQLISGDQVRITGKNNAVLSFIDGHTTSTITRFVSVDELDSVRLYNSFADAVNGGKANAIALAAISSKIEINVQLVNADRRLLAQCNGYELNTERETVDTTALSDEFRSRISTLMSGSGRMSCFWNYTGSTSDELANYLLELQIRTRVGSQFKARFYLKTDAHNPSGVSANANDNIWYEFSGVLTSCAVQFSPSNSVQITADFITTGSIQIRMELESVSKILQEDNGKILLEQGTTDALGLEGD